MGYDWLHGNGARYRIAVIPERRDRARGHSGRARVLEAAGRAHGFRLELTEFPGVRLLRRERADDVADALDTLRSDAIFLGAVGRPDVPDHISLWGLLIPIRRTFRQYVNLRPIRLWPGIHSPCATSPPSRSTW